LEEERVRIENYLRTKGYFDFSKEYIYFMADTLEKQKKVDLTLGIKAYKKSVDSDNEIEPHPRYIIADIYVFTDYNKAKVLENRKLFFNSLDTLCYDSLYFLYHDEININPSILKQNIYISQNEWYNRKSVNETYMHLSSLNVLKLVDISFKTQQDTVYANDSIRYLDCYIQLTPSALQAYSIEIEGNNSSGDIGIAGNLTYQHRNFFNSAEVFDFKVRGAIEAVKERYKGKLDNTTEFGSEVRLRIPQFFLPWTRDNFVKRYNPRTNFVLSYNHQRRPDYTRRIINTSFGYNWMGFNYTSHRVNPFELNLVKLLESTDAFKLRINKNPYLKNSYEEHFILVSKYSFVFNNQKVSANKDFIYFRLNAESAGNLITGINDLLEMPKVNSRYQLFGNRYAQYIKGDFDIRYYHQLNDQDQIVFRVFAGAAYPYNNSNAVPFEKKYFAGGANSIRGWQVRSLGPGSYNEQVFTAFPNSLADIKLESNIEYRFDMFWIIKGALFIDAGNIWSIQPEDDRPGAVFKVDKFYKDIAVGSGFGTRFDLSFFIFRIDLGFKIHNPVKGHQKWIFSEKNIGPDDFNVNIGIGYPF
jgi:outer membrane protein assembly factor BamA